MSTATQDAARVADGKRVRRNMNRLPEEKRRWLIQRGDVGAIRGWIGGYHSQAEIRAYLAEEARRP